MSSAFKAIADPTRRAILEALGREEMAVQEISSGFAMSRPAVSKHLRILKEAGLLLERSSGRNNFYRLEPGPLAEVSEWLTSLGGVRRRSTESRKRRREGKAARPAPPAPQSDDWRVW